MATKTLAVNLEIDGGKSQKQLKTVQGTLKDIEKDLRNISKVDATAKAEQSFNDLNKAVDENALSLKDMTKAMDSYISIAAAAGRTSPIGREAIQRAGLMKDEIDGLRMDAQSASKDFGNLQAAMKLGQGVIGAYSAFQGTVALLGIENEALMETMVKLQAANSVLMGVESVRQALEKESILVQKLSAFWTAVQTKATKAQSKAKKKDIQVTGLVTAAQWLWNAAMMANPVVLIVVAIAALVAGLVTLAMTLGDSSDEFDKAAAKQEAFNDAVKEANLSTVEQKTQLETLIAVAKDETASLEAREQALIEVKKAGVGYLDNLTLQNIATAEGLEMIENYTKALNDKAEAEAVNAKLVELNKQKIEIQAKTVEDSLSWWDKEVALFKSGGDMQKYFGDMAKTSSENIEAQTKAINDEIEAVKELAAEQEKERLANTAAEEKAAKELKAKQDAEKKAADARKKRQADRKKQREQDDKDAEKAEADRVKNLIASQQFADALVIQMMKDTQEKEEALRTAAWEKQIGDLEKNGQLTAEIEKNLEKQLLNDLAAIKEKHAKEQEAKNVERIKKENDLRIELMKEGAAKEREAELIALEVRIEQLREDKLLTDEVETELRNRTDEKLAAITEKWNDKEVADTKAAEKEKQEARKQSLDNAATAIQGLATINDAITEAQLNAAGDDEKKKEAIRKKAFEREKKLNIAMALINGAQSIAAAIATGPPQGYVFAAINAGIMVAQIAAISSAKYSGGGGSASVAAPSTAGLSVGDSGPTITGNENDNTITDTASLLDGEGEGVATKVFVSAVDISNVQTTTDKIETIGTVGE